MGSLFEAYGVPETENYTNVLAYFYRVKYTIDEYEYSEILMVKADDLTLKEEGKFEAASDEYVPFFEALIAQYEEALGEALEDFFPELAGKNTGTFKQD